MSAYTSPSSPYTSASLAPPSPSMSPSTVCRHRKAVPRSSSARCACACPLTADTIPGLSRSSSASTCALSRRRIAMSKFSMRRYVRPSWRLASSSLRASAMLPSPTFSTGCGALGALSVASSASRLASCTRRASSSSASSLSRRSSPLIVRSLVFIASISNLLPRASDPPTTAPTNARVCPAISAMVMAPIAHGPCLGGGGRGAGAAAWLAVLAAGDALESSQRGCVGRGALAD
mmetsp:Transcript_19915/g.63368  ORF Transcript_19915/g.63368 Transcript_19915/m.63368 type:complete len:234 (+) Transcript_19915:192-893(+)